MARTNGFDHVATVTTDLARVVAFYRDVFDAQITLEMAATEHHPRMVILDLGGSALNITEQPEETIVGERSRPGARGAIDHYGIALATRTDLNNVRQRLVDAGIDVGSIQRLGDTWSLFFRDPDGMELEVCARIEEPPAESG
jgi:catechol 2,3-dioxygenase-like lactoylglutathione lyase family enzyme